VTYNAYSGAFKNLEAGHYLLPLLAGTANATTDATTVKTARLGSTLAVFNTNATTVYSITLSKANTVAAGTAGTVVGEDVSVPCKPLDWTYLNTYDKQFLITEDADLLVFVVADDSYISTLQGA
jgi:hypothetical protein